MKIVFRTDASLQIGSGHVMRCLTLADELRQRGADVQFVCRENLGHLVSLIEGKGYPVVPLPQAKGEYMAAPGDLHHAGWLGVFWQLDAAETIAAMNETRPDWLIVDHYALDCRWEQKMRPYIERIMVIDDLADRPHDCDLLLDQNLYQSMEARYENLIPSNCINLLGPDYALLRPEFAAARKYLRQRAGSINRILVFFGGVDISNETEKVLQVLASFTERDFEVDVVVGGGHLYKEQIQNLCSTHDGFHYHCQVDNMAELMAAADLAVGAGGTATWERCSLGLPSLVIALAENQVNIAQSADKAGVLKYLGQLSAVSFKDLSQHLSATFTSGAILNDMSEKAQYLVDGNGTLRVVSNMEHL